MPDGDESSRPDKIDSLSDQYKELIDRNASLIKSVGTMNESAATTLNQLKELVKTLNVLVGKEKDAQGIVNRLVEVLTNLEGKVGKAIESDVSIPDIKKTGVDLGTAAQGAEEEMKILNARASKLEDNESEARLREEDEETKEVLKNFGFGKPAVPVSGPAKGGSHSRKRRSKTKRKNLKGGKYTKNKRKRKTMKGGYKNKNKSIYKNEIFPDMVK